MATSYSPRRTVWPGRNLLRVRLLVERQWPQLKGQFLIDRDGIVRWANVECARDGLAGIGKFPSAEEILAAARTLT